METENFNNIKINTNIGFETQTIIAFVSIVLICLLIDLFSHRRDKALSFKAACGWSIFWVFISLCFAGFLYYHFNSDVSSLFLSGYVLEKSLSVDNLFVMMAIFSWFKIPQGIRHRVLYYGIVGAIVFRAIFVAIGSSLLYLGESSSEIFEFIVYLIFAGCVIYSAIQMLKGDSGDDDDEIQDYSNHKAYRFGKWLFPIWPKLHGHNFFLSRSTVQSLTKEPENRSISLKRTGLIFATPLFLCLLVIELSDVMFSFDSVPAVIAVSKEPLIIYSAMIFAILGLRSMYFVLEAMKKYLCHLEKAVIVLLFFIGFKLFYNSLCKLIDFDLTISNHVSLIFILSTLSIGVVASVIFPEKEGS